MSANRTNLQTVGHANQPAEVSDSALNVELLFESVICNLHWNCLHAGIISYLVSAARKTGAPLRLNPWRHVLVDNTRISLFALQYGPEIKIPSDCQMRLVKFYSGLSSAISITQELRSRSDHSQYTSSVTQTLSSAWQKVSQDAVQVIDAMEPMTRAHLSSAYLENGRILKQFFHDALTGNVSRLNQWGELTLPVLAQKRRDPRITLSQDCSIALANGSVIKAVLRDVSCNGLGLVCSAPISLQSAVTVRLADGRELPATVVRNDDALVGLLLRTPLSSRDALFSGGSRR